MRETAGILARVALIVAGVMGCLAEIDRPNNERRVLEATVQMERPTTKLAHATTIAVETKLEITRVVQRPWYDCNQITCRAAFEARNGAARAHLRTVIAGGRVRTLSAHDKATRME